MTVAELIALINQEITANGNNEITGPILNDILVKIVNQINEKVGELSDLETSDTTNIVAAINSVLNSQNIGVVVHYGQNDPNVTPPSSYEIGDMYSKENVLNNTTDLFIYTGVPSVGWLNLTSLGGWVESVTGNIVDNTDPLNPVVTQVQSDWNEANNASPSFIKNKPAIPTGGVQSVTGDIVNNTDPDNPEVFTVFNVNLFNKRDIIEEFDTRTNPAPYTANSGHTNFIKLVPGKKLFCKKLTGAPTGAAFYTANKTYISGGSGILPSGTFGEVTVPSNARYIRCNIYNMAATKQDRLDAFMIYHGVGDVSYREYADNYSSIIDFYQLLPKDIPYADELNTSRMHSVKNKLSRIVQGDTSLTCVIGLWGDSLTQINDIMCGYSLAISKFMRKTYGDGGGGYYDFAKTTNTGQTLASVDPDDAYDERSGAFNYFDAETGVVGISIASIEMLEDAKITLNITKPHTRLVIHYWRSLTSHGTFRYRVDGGTWTTVNTNGASSVQKISLDVSDDTHVLEFERLTGGPMIQGVDMQRSSGCRIHKFGNRGLFAADINAITAATWQNCLEAFDDLDAFTITIGGNDRTQNTHPVKFYLDVKKIYELARAAMPHIDIALIAESNNERTAPTYSMSQYAQSMYLVANEKGAPFISLIPLFGSSADIVANGYWYDEIHPTLESGTLIGYYIIDKLLTAYFSHIYTFAVGIPIDLDEEDTDVPVLYSKNEINYVGEDDGEAALPDPILVNMHGREIFVSNESLFNFKVKGSIKEVGELKTEIDVSAGLNLYMISNGKYWIVY